MGQGADAEVVAEHELDLAIRLGAKTEGIIFNGPVKPLAALERAIAIGAGVINIETWEEANLLSRLAEARGRVQSVAVRIDTGVAAHQSLDPTFSGRIPSPTKFGWSLETGEALDFCRRVAALPGLRLDTLQMNLGSQIVSPHPYVEGLKRLSSLAELLRNEGTWITSLDLGGGLGVPGITRNKSGPLSHLVDALGGLGPKPDLKEPYDPAVEPQQLVPTLAGVIRGRWADQPTLIFDPGRFLVSEAINLVTRVCGIKRTVSADWVYLDAGINLLPDAPGDQRRFELVRSGESQAQLRPFRLAGPLCLKSDLLANHVMLPEDLAVGELIVVCDAGAYSVSRASPFGMPRAPVVAVSKDSSRLVWRRETFDDMYAFDVGTLR
jgi:diaminopimelate decarboxylase